MFTIQQMIEYTRAFNPNILKNAARVSVRYFTADEAWDEDGDRYVDITAICKGDTIPREVTIRRYGKGKTAKIWVSCTCEAWKYFFEVAVFKKSGGTSTDNLYADIGKDKKINNPRRLSGLCKHCLAAIIAGAADLKPTKEVKKKK